MHFVIVGAGAVGGYFGARLASVGEKVTFIARNEHLAAMKSQGLMVESINGDVHLASVNAQDNFHGITDVDVILLSVKSFQLTAILSELKPIISHQTRIIPLLNGVNAIELLTNSGIPAEQIYGGLVKIISTIKSPGVISHLGTNPHITLELIAAQRNKIEPIEQVLKEAGISVGLTENIHVALWRKFIFVAGWGALAAKEDKTVGELRRDNHDSLVQIINEYAKIATAEGIAITDEMVNEIIQFLSALPENSKTSMQRDISKGQVSEFDILVKHPYQLAKKHQLHVPVLNDCYQQLASEM